jgi:Tfp pilus assembly protein PilF
VPVRENRTVIRLHRTRQQRSGATPIFLGPCAIVGLVSVVSVIGVSACAGSSTNRPPVANPERASEAEYDLSRDAFEKGRLREALDHAQKALQLDDSNVKAMYFTSLVYLGFCNVYGMKAPDCHLADAEDFARKAMAADDQFRDARNTLGTVLILEQKYAEAMRVLEPLTKDPAYVSSSLAWGNFGWAQVLSGKVDDGIASLRNAVTDPRFCIGHYRLGMAFEKKRDFVAAEKSFSDAVQVQIPECQGLQDAWFERGRVRLKLGNVNDAQSDFARCRDIGADTDTGKECAKLAGNAAASPIPVQAGPAGPATPAALTNATTSAPQAAAAP